MRQHTDVAFRYARRGDEAKIMEFVKELAAHHGERGVPVTEEALRTSIFEEERAEVIFVLNGTEEAGFALFFHNFSSVLGKTGIHLEDLYVKQKYRGLGYGKALLVKLADIAAERGCGRIEWMCHTENVQSLRFYRGLGADELAAWRLFRLEGEALHALAGENQA